MSQFTWFSNSASCGSSIDSRNVTFAGLEMERRLIPWSQFRERMILYRISQLCFPSLIQMKTLYILHSSICLEVNKYHRYINAENNDIILGCYYRHCWALKWHNQKLGFVLGYWELGIFSVNQNKKEIQSSKVSSPVLLMSPCSESRKGVVSGINHHEEWENPETFRSTSFF